ncbi:MAG: hypothetical protein Kow0010_06560 [Dehalococcoidia bacterium]
MAGERVEDLLRRRDVAGLERALRSADRDLRGAAARALATIATTQPPRPLISAGGEEESDRAIRLDAVNALASHNSRLAVALLSEALESPDVSRRLFAVEALAATGSGEAIEALARVLATDDEWQVRRAAALALEGTGGAAADHALNAYHKPPRAITVPEGAGERIEGLARYLSDPTADAEARRGALLRLEQLGTATSEAIVKQYHEGTAAARGGR